MDEHLKRLMSEIDASGRPPVGSIIMTLFGDAIVPRGGAVSARTVREILARLGIEAGTKRTAFSRLVQDGWVTRQKKGRESFYQLSEPGYSRIKEATGQLYQPPSEPNSASNKWLIAVSPASASQPVLIEKPDGAELEKLRDEDYLIVVGQLEHVPDWIRNVYAPPQANEAFRHFIDQFTPLEKWQPSPVDALAARALLIHEWQRLLLGNRPVPPQLRPQGWLEEDSHELTATLYRKLLPESEAWLDDHGTGPDGPLPEADASVIKRFF